MFLAKGECVMTKYDISYANKEQYSLFFSIDGGSCGLINRAKSVSYLKGKMKAHRDQMVDAGYDDVGYYSIKAPNNDIIYTQTFSKGVRGESKVPYHVEAPKQKINYKKAYLYDRSGDIVVEEKAGAFAVAHFDVICNDIGDVITDLKLLKSLNDFIFYEQIPVMVTHKAQVSIATYLPQTREEFINLPGCGEKLFNKCGEMIIEFINAYLNNKVIKAWV